MSAEVAPVAMPRGRPRARAVSWKKRRLWSPRQRVEVGAFSASSRERRGVDRGAARRRAAATPSPLERRARRASPREKTTRYPSPSSPGVSHARPERTAPRGSRPFAGLVAGNIPSTARAHGRRRAARRSPAAPLPPPAVGPSVGEPLGFAAREAHTSAAPVATGRRADASRSVLVEVDRAPRSPCGSLVRRLASLRSLACSPSSACILGGSPRPGRSCGALRSRRSRSRRAGSATLLARGDSDRHEHRDERKTGQSACEQKSHRAVPPPPRIRAGSLTECRSNEPLPWPKPGKGGEGGGFRRSTACGAVRYHGLRGWQGLLPCQPSVCQDESRTGSS